MNDSLDPKKKKSRKDKQPFYSEEQNMPNTLDNAREMQEKIEMLEEKVAILETRFRLLEEMVPKELRSLSNRIATLGRWVGYDKGEKPEG
ncbi:MAG: hypothetical protein HQL67_10435 [Magnetococcales bacterium]|nr:hypothetical protein [Magnetococcales bacterium]